MSKMHGCSDCGDSVNWLYRCAGCGEYVCLGCSEDDLATGRVYCRICAESCMDAYECTCDGEED